MREREKAPVYAAREIEHVATQASQGRDARDDSSTYHMRDHHQSSSMCRSAGEAQPAAHDSPSSRERNVCRRD
jgi:hypothetical protein